MNIEKLRGVNLGGWLLLEEWITPSLFGGTQSIDEYTFMQTTDAKKKIENHRQSFIVESDFKWLHTNGINAVRIPVGYWVLRSEPPFVSAQKYLDWAMKMAGKYSLQVIIDLHGVKGSQNGQDHSGKVGKSEWFHRSDYRNETIATLEQIATRYQDYDNFWGLQVINEPKLGLLHPILRRFYRDAYKHLTQVLKPTTRIIFSDAFTPRLFTGFLRPTTHPVVMDVHIYHMTTLLSKYLSLEWFLRKTTRRKKMLARLSQKQPVIVGEWSGIIRHETINKIPPKEQVDIFRSYVRLQMDVYENTAGWFYWNYKTEAPGVWNFRSQVEAGLIDVRYTETRTSALTFS